jgi:hypothetical protein
LIWQKFSWRRTIKWFKIMGMPRKPRVGF